MHAGEHTLIFCALDGELNADEVERLHRLLDRSSEARAELEALHTLRRIVAEHGSTTFAPDFSSRVMRRLPERTRRPERPSRPLQPSKYASWRCVGWAVGAFVVLMSIVIALSRWPQTVRVP